MTIRIDAVPVGTRKPGAYLNINTSGAKLGLPVVATRILILATMLAAGTATAAEPVQVTSQDVADTYFGQGSPCSLMCQAVLEQYPYVAELWVCPLDESGTGVASSGSLAFTTASLTAGTLYVYIGRHVVSVGLTTSDDQDTVAVAVAAAVNADGSLPFSASSLDETVTLDCKTEGTQGNKWVFAYDYTGTGLTAVVTQPTTGANDPNISTALTAVAPDQWDIIVSEWNDATSLDALVAHLDDVSGPMEQRPGVGVAGFVGTVGNATTLTTARNSGRLTVGYMRGTRTHPYELAAAYAALIASESDVARPLNGLELEVGVIPDTLTDRLTRSEQETLLLNGVAPFEVKGKAVTLVRSVTTYVEDANTNADDTLLDLQTIRTLDYVRYVCRLAIQNNLSRVKIADEAVSPNTTDPGKIRSLLLGTLLQLEAAGYVERVEEWRDRLVVERDGDNPTRVNATIPADIVDGLHVFAADINLILA